MKLSLLIIFFVLAYVISWIIWLPLYLPYFGISGLPVLPFHHALGALGPVSAAFIVSAKEGGATEVKKLLSNMGRWKVSPLWYFVAFFSPFIMLFTGILLYNSIVDNPINFEEILKNKEFPEFTLFTFFIYNLISFGFGEETGWRGFALSNLQDKMPPLFATLVLTIFWAAWHIPLFFYRSGYVGMDIFGIIGWTLSLLTGAVLLTWLFNSSKKSILIVSVFHATIDIAFTSNASTPGVSQNIGILITVFGIVVLFGSRFRLGYFVK